MAGKVLLVVLGLIASIAAQCTPSITTASGPKAPGQICSGQLLFGDDFDTLDLSNWNYDYTETGGEYVTNGEFQAYQNLPKNSFAEFGHYTIRPTLENGDTEIYSARMTTQNAFRFKYGRVEINAKVPKGDWLWTALWMMPHDFHYGDWPRSGELDITEVRGNAGYTSGGHHIGIEQAASTLHYGPNEQLNGFMKARYESNPNYAFDEGYHRYQVEWTDEYFKFSIDDQEIGTVRPGAGGFWELGEFGNQAGNPWTEGGHMAPFDQEFYVILCLAVGGTSGYFPDYDVAYNPNTKPWANTQSQPEAFANFMNAKGDWIPTWNMNENNGDQSSLKVDYVRIWAI